MLLNKNTRIRKEKLKNYFEYKNKRSISIINVVSLMAMCIIFFNIFSGIRDIMSMQDYIVSNESRQSINLDSRNKVAKIGNKQNKKINMGNVRKIIETVGVENLDTLSINQNKVKVIGRTNDVKIIEKLMKNKILNNSYVKKIEGGEEYTFEIETGAIQ